MSGPERATGAVLADAPPGSIVAASTVVAIRNSGRTVQPWVITGERGGYTTGDLLAMSQEWTVLRRGWPTGWSQ